MGLYNLWLRCHVKCLSAWLWTWSRTDECNYCINYKNGEYGQFAIKEQECHYICVNTIIMGVSSVCHSDPTRYQTDPKSTLCRRLVTKTPWLDLAKTTDFWFPVDFWHDILVKTWSFTLFSSTRNWNLQINNNKLQLTVYGAWWRFGWVDTFQPDGRGFESCSSHHIEPLGKSLTCSCLWRFDMKLRHSIRAVSGALLSSSGF